MEAPIMRWVCPWWFNAVDSLEATMAYNVKSMPSTKLVTGAGRISSLQPGPRIARKEAAALNGPTGNGAPLLVKYGPQVVVARRNGKAIASIPLAQLANLKLGK